MWGGVVALVYMQRPKEDLLVDFGVRLAVNKLQQFSLLGPAQYWGYRHAQSYSSF